MSIKQQMMTAGAVCVAAVCASHSYGQAYLSSLRGQIRIDGSSTVYPITEAVAEEFAEVAPNVRITVGISGTGGGFKRFTVGETDISDASRPIKLKEYQATQKNGVDFIEIPVAYDGLSIVVNKANTWADQLTVDDLKKIFLSGSTVSTWKDIRAEWPDVPVKIYAPGTDSGTFDYFKEVVAGKTGAIRSDMSVSEDDNVLVRGVSGETGGIGFFGCAYFFENKDKLRAVPIVNPTTDEPVSPTAKTIESGAYAPFSRPLFIYVNRESADRPAVKAFVKYYLEEGPELAEEVGYVKLPKSVYTLAARKFANQHTGTHYLDKDGNKVHGSIVEVYK
ncbi:MAG: PstS family phosphate ABC transporter substrate-binding protein [Planctomycetes bacterium]|nr:PstS family phosphate ABC transporter substrate-binding protein [Planctomycetota bacterium]NOG54728.1 PstS family phosphate ABC transporter substrate-binding protein [Planctomycetota bacterium]